MKSKNIILFFIALYLVSCSAGPTPVPIQTVFPTFTDLPPTSTASPSPTFTSTAFPSPTITPGPTSTFAPVPARRARDDSISGTYELDRGAGEICVFKVVLEPVVSTDQEIAFEIFCKRGPPQYRSGHVMAKVIISDNVAIYTSPRVFGDSTCQLTFKFKRKTVEVTQSGVELACEFEQGIHADGTYQLTNDTPPILGCMNDENPCGLDDPIP